MKLSELIESICVRSVSGSLDVNVSGVFFDSRKVVDGGVFCALAGQGDDGNQYIDAAIENGAVAVISGQPYASDFAVTWVQTDDPRLAMGIAAANLEGYPSRELPVIGVTGTNGKTTTTFLIHHLIESILHRAGLIGTINYVIGDEFEDAPHTTPESPELQKLLREMLDSDCRAVAMEVSSHGVTQKRVAGVSFDVGVFTNLTQDHLDFHGGMENYFEAKAAMFTAMDLDSSKKGVAIINADDSYGERLRKRNFERLKVYTFGRSAKADFQASNIRSDFDGTEFKLSFGERSFLVRTPLIGAFNVYNSVAAIASAYGVGLNLRETVSKMAEAPQVPGRLEAVGDRKINYRVFVDYAHTPDAIISVLRTLRDLGPNRIITVFGCGGDRDTAKRAMMAKAAEDLSDLCILTTDNPRTEPPAKILEDVETGFQRHDYEVIEDRKLAIKRAIRLAEERDIVLIAGKGHETYQEIDGIRHEFDDRRIAVNFIREKAEGGER